MTEETRSISCIPEKPGLLMVKGRRPANDRDVTAKEIFLGDPLAFTSFPPHKDMLLISKAL